jgi:hypothetical protein
MRHIPETFVRDDERTSAPSLPPSPFGDIPGPIWTAFLSTWALLFGLFLIFFTKDGPAAMSVVTASFFALMLLGLPAALGAQTLCPERQSKGSIQVHTGPISVGAAATQILLIPVASVIGLTLLIILAV